MSLKDTRLVKNNKKEKKEDAAEVKYAEAAGPALTANNAESTSVSETKTAKARCANARFL